MAEGRVEGEKELIAAAQEGNQGALTELFNTHFPSVYRYILARTGHPQDAEDLAQEVFMRMLDGLGRYRWREVPFRAWLFKIAHNVVVSRYRRDGHWLGRVTPLSDTLAIPATGPEEEAEARFALEEVFQAARRLPLVQRRVIELRFAAGLSVAETAQILGKTENNVKVIQHKAIYKLREVLTAVDGVAQEQR